MAPGTPVRPHPDPSLRLRRLQFDALFHVGTSRPVTALAAWSVAPDSPRLALTLGESLLQTPRRVLAFTCHPDDLEFFAGGTLRRMALAGSKITAVVLSGGEKRGNWKELADQRRHEQTHAAALQGYADLHFEDLPDFGLPEDPRLEPILARAWDRVWPDVVFAFDPKELLPQTANRDHKALGRAVMDLSRARFHTGAEVYFYGTRHPDTLVDITPVMADKLEAVKAHQSQMVLLSEDETDATFRTMGQVYAGASGARYAEPLFRLM